MSEAPRREPAATAAADVPSAVIEATERWFVRSGLPHAIAGYSATTDVLTRAAPFLTIVFFLEVFISFSDRFDGWEQAAAFVGSLLVLGGMVALVNRLRGRRLFQRPDDIEWPDLALFVFAPALLPVLFSDDRGFRFLAIVGFNLALLALTYVATSYALLPMIRFGATLMWQRLPRVGTLIARILPVLLLFTTFIFLNAEMWQVSSDFAPPFFAIVVVVMALSGVGFMILRAPREVSDLERFESWASVCRYAAESGAPLAARRPPGIDDCPAVPELDRSARRNVALLVVISQAVQVVLVGLVIGAFYVGFGLLAVRTETIDQWTVDGADPLATFDLFGSTVIVTWEHFVVSGFIGAFSALQFAVSIVTDESYRAEFSEDVTREIRQVLAVRALYHEALGNCVPAPVPAPAPAPDPDH